MAKVDSAEAFATHAAAVAFLNAIAPGSLDLRYAAIPMNASYTINEDGSLTITTKE